MSAAPLLYIDGPYSSSCGYCKHKIKPEPLETNHQEVDEEPLRKENFGVEAYNVPAEIYDSLVQYNWRRCGSLFYKPSNETMCCPQYAIRVPAVEFSISDAGHRRLLRKLGRYLKTGTIIAPSSVAHRMETDKESPSPKDSLRKFIELDLQRAFQECCESEFLNGDVLPEIRVKVRQDRPKSELFSKYPGVYYSSSLVLSLFGQYKKLKIPISHSPCDVSSRISNHLKNNPSFTNKLEIESCSNGFLNFYPKEIVHIEHDNTTASPHVPTGGSNDVFKLILHVDPAGFKPDEFSLYSVYQQQIHKDFPSKITKGGYSNFLCDSSLVYESSESFEIQVIPTLTNSHEFDFRIPKDTWKFNQSYHIRYELESENGTRQMIAISVIDVLPSGFSSVYFIYDPTFAFLSPGVISALLELMILKRRLHVSCPQYYYLGYYIHNCSKMRYKAQFSPSDLLCPDTLTWTRFDKRVSDILDAQRHARFAMETVESNWYTEEEIDLEELKYLLSRNLIVKGSHLFEKLELSQHFKDLIRSFCRIAPRDIWYKWILIVPPNDIGQIK